MLPIYLSLELPKVIGPAGKPINEPSQPSAWPFFVSRVVAVYQLFLPMI